MSARENPRAANARAPQTSNTNHLDRTEVAPAVGIGLDAADAGRLASHRDYAVLVVVGLAGGGSRARVVMTLAAAERLVDNARRRDLPAQLTLVRLTPVTVAPRVLSELLAVSA